MSREPSRGRRVEFAPAPTVSRSEAPAPEASSAEPSEAEHDDVEDEASEHGGDDAEVIVPGVQLPAEIVNRVRVFLGFIACCRCA